MTSKVSIIVPISGEGEFLQQCINSILAQTHREIEILCVNAGATSDSLQMLEDFASKDARVKLFAQENGDRSAAKNLALKEATGEYLLFCEAKDYYEPSYCEDMLDAITSQDVDIAMCDCNLLSEDANVLDSETQKDPRYLKFFHKMPLTQILKSRINAFLWNKIFKLSLIRKYEIAFQEKCGIEDAFVYEYLAVSTSYFGLEKKLYNFRRLKCSRVKNVSQEEAFLYIDTFVFALDFFKKHNLFNANKWIVKRLNNNVGRISNLLNKKHIGGYIATLKEKVLDSFDISEFEFFYNLRNVYANDVNVSGHFPFQKKTFPTKKIFYFFGIPIFKKVAIGNNRKYYFCGIQILKKNVINQKRQYYFFGLKFLQKNINPLAGKFSKSKQHKSLMDKAASFKDLPLSEKYIICFDCLHDKNAEAIDAYSFFRYLQANNIKSKYIIFKDNSKADDISLDKDVIVVKDQYDFLYNNMDIIAKSHTIASGFGCLNGFDQYLKSLPFTKRIFIDHGVLWLKKWVCSLYNTEKFDYILSASKKTEELYLNRKHWASDQMIKSGLPRWDNLVKEQGEQKNIFLFFTWRKSLEGRSNLSQKYLNYILSLLNNPYIQEIATKQNIKINVSLHHSLFYNEVTAPKIPDYVNLVESTQISKLISKTDLLITDYSSICFDFMYLNTPVAFYLFDADDLSLNNVDQVALLEMMQEEKYLYNYCYTEEALIEKIEHYINNDFTLEPENLEKNNQIFWDKRTNNCEQLYQALLKLEKNAE